MNNVVRTAIACALAGVVVTAVVALACAIAAQISGGSAVFLSHLHETRQLLSRYHSPHYEDSPFEPYWTTYVAQFQRFGYDEIYFLSHAVDFERQHEERIEAIWIKAGWPLFSLTHDARNAVDHDEWSNLSLTLVMQGGAVASMNTNSVLWPAVPIWGGFIVNSLFFAGAVWLLFFAPFAARRMVRRRRGLCEKCAYPIGVSPVCTECGAEIITSRRRTTPAADAP